MTTAARLVRAMRDAVRAVEVHSSKTAQVRMRREVEQTVGFIERNAASVADGKPPTTGMIGAAKLLVRDLKMRPAYRFERGDARPKVDALARIVARLFTLRELVGDDDLDGIAQLRPVERAIERAHRVRKREQLIEGRFRDRLAARFGS